jgi:uncharacterized protein
LLDVNVLIALTEPGHAHYQRAQEWFNTRGRGKWGVCPLTEAGFLRVTTNPMFRPIPRTLEQATAILELLKGHSDFWYWAIDESWVTLTAPFAARISGHQQITDAYLLGLAIKEDDMLVTFDRGIRFLAGPEFGKNLLVLE